MTRRIQDFDIRLGELLRYYRKFRKVSQQELADYLGVSFQQVQKYEKATNRISVCTLVKISQKLKIPISEFFVEYSFSKNNKVDTLSLEFNQYPQKARKVALKILKNLTNENLI